MRTQMCMLFLTAWILTGCQVPVPPSRPAAVAALEQSEVDLSRMLTTYRCYRLTGRSEEAQEAKEHIVAVVAGSATTIGLWQRLLVLTALRESCAIVDTYHIAAARRDKRLCGERLGIYELA